MFEDKQKICDKLLETLRLTRQFEDLKSLIYVRESDDHETVTAIFEEGSVKEINVSLDSGAAMVRDILGQLV